MILRETLNKIRQIEIRTNSNSMLCLALVLTGGLSGCSTTNQHAKWPVFYDCEKPPDRISIAYEPQPLATYTNGIPDWNYNLRIPAATISSAKVTDLIEVEGLRVVEVRLALTDTYYTDALMILQEVKPNQFLPVYVQDYNRNLRVPSENMIAREKTKALIKAGMDYSGTGHFHTRYRIAISPSHKPTVTESSIDSAFP